jgi:hypothetical protein
LRVDRGQILRREQLAERHHAVALLGEVGDHALLLIVEARAVG